MKANKVRPHPSGNSSMNSFALANSAASTTFSIDTPPKSRPTPASLSPSKLSLAPASTSSPAGLIMLLVGVVAAKPYAMFCAIVLRSMESHHGDAHVEETLELEVEGEIIVGLSPTSSHVGQKLVYHDIPAPRCIIQHKGFELSCIVTVVSPPAPYEKLSHDISGCRQPN